MFPCNSGARSSWPDRVGVVFKELASPRLSQSLLEARQQLKSAVEGSGLV
jgi:hypothetical protein